MFVQQNHLRKLPCCCVIETLLRSTPNLTQKGKVANQYLPPGTRSYIYFHSLCCSQCATYMMSIGLQAWPALRWLGPHYFTKWITFLSLGTCIRSGEMFHLTWFLGMGVVKWYFSYSSRLTRSTSNLAREAFRPCLSYFVNIVPGSCLALWQIVMFGHETARCSWGCGDGRKGHKTWHMSQNRWYWYLIWVVGFVWWNGSAVSGIKWSSPCVPFT